MHKSSKRQLAAILFADIVGYSALMQEDEMAALAKLNHFKQQIHEKTNHYHGQVVQFYGDGCLITFNSASDAIACAAALQILFQEMPLVPVRIGIHSGEVLYKEGNIFGDSVNIAARIESMGISGAILFSNAIKDQIQNKREFQYQLLGDFVFKNIEGTLPIYALSNLGIKVPTKLATTQKSKKVVVYESKRMAYTWLMLPILSLFLLAALGVWYFKNTTATPANYERYGFVKTNNNKQTIAVLPFVNRSNIPENQYFADGIQDDLLTNLAQIGSMNILSRTSMEYYRDTKKSIPQIAKELKANYVVEGGVQRTDNQVRINVQFIDAATDTHLWSKIYTEVLSATNLFKIQGDIAKNIAVSLNETISPQKEMELATTPTQNIEAYNLYLLARHKIKVRKSKELKEAQELLERVIKMDPNFVQAYNALGLTYYLRYYYADLQKEKAMLGMEAATNQSFKLNPHLAEGYAVRGLLKQLRPNGILAARKDLEKALAVDPNLVPAYSWLANNYVGTKEEAKALDLRLKAATIDPLSQLNLQGIAWLYSALGEHEQVLNYFRKGQDIFAHTPQNYWVLGYHYQSQTDSIEQAALAFDKAIQYDPRSLRYLYYRFESLLDLQLITECEEVLETMKQIDPNNHRTKWATVFLMQSKQQYQAAIDYYNQPEKKPEAWLLANLYFSKKDYANAVAALEQAHPQWTQPIDSINIDALDLWDALNYAGSLKGLNPTSQKAKDLLALCLKTYEKYDQGNIVIPVNKVWILTLQGATEKAITYLDSIVKEQKCLADWWEIETNPAFEQLRQHPRYPKIMQQIRTKVSIQAETYKGNVQ